MPKAYFMYPFREGQLLRLKKAHPCGSREWRVSGVSGEAVQLICKGCGREMTLSRSKLEAALREVLEGGIPDADEV